DFAECGELVSCRCLKNEDGQLKGIAFVEFKDEEAVKKALEFNETEYSGRTIYVSKAGDREGKSKDGKGKKGKATSANKAAK
ncbi:PABN3, partial [Symbiodinium necroappetens]